MSILIHLYNEIISQFCVLTNQADQLPSFKESRASLNCFALATNKIEHTDGDCRLTDNVATRYSAVTLLLACVSPVSLTERIFFSPLIIFIVLTPQYIVILVFYSITLTFKSIIRLSGPSIILAHQVLSTLSLRCL